MIDHKFTCDARNCESTALNGKKYADLPEGWGAFKISARHTVNKTMLIETGGDLCPTSLERLAHLLVKDDAWSLIGYPKTGTVENPFPVVKRETAHVDPKKRVCVFCACNGPFDTTEEVTVKTGGAYTWTTICKWCEADVLLEDRPADAVLYAAGPTGREKKTPKTV